MKRWAWVAARWAVAPALLLGLRLAWGAEASNRLAREQASVRSHGIHVSMAENPDFASVPPQENAFTFFVKACQLFELPDDERNIVVLSDKKVGIDRVEFTPAEIEVLKRLWMERREVIVNLDRAALMPQCVWPNDYNYYYGPTSQFSWVWGRMLCSWCLDQALVDASEGRGAAAIVNLRRTMKTAEISHAQPSYLSALVAGAIRAEVVRLLERLDQRLDWSDPAVVAEARLLLADMLAVPEAIFLKDWSHEFTFVEYQSEKFRRDGIWWIEPLIRDDEARSLRQYAVNLPAYQAANYPEMQRRAIASPADPTVQFSKVRQLISSGADFEASMGRVYFARITDLSAGSCLLAARLSHCDHKRFPTLAELVPQYMPRIPIDPFDPDGKPLRYRVDPGGPTIWSVGENARDENAKTATPGSDMMRLRNPDIAYGAAWRDYLATIPP